MSNLVKIFIFKRTRLNLLVTLLCCVFLASCFSSNSNWDDSQAFTKPEEIRKGIEAVFGEAEIPLPPDYIPLSSSQIWDKKNEYHRLYARVRIHHTQTPELLLLSDVYEIPLTNTIVGHLHQWPYEPNLPYPPTNAKSYERYVGDGPCEKYHRKHCPTSSLSWTFVISYQGTYDDIYLGIVSGLDR